MGPATLGVRSPPGWRPARMGRPSRLRGSPRGAADRTPRCNAAEVLRSHAEVSRMEHSLESALAAWDGESILLHRDHPTGAWIVIAIHSTRLGPAAGGTRMKTYPDLAAAVQDAQRLAAGMTAKLALPGLGYGGGKSLSAPASRFPPQQRPAPPQRPRAPAEALGGALLPRARAGPS